MIRTLITLLLLCASCGFPDYSHIQVTEVIDGDTVRLSNGKLLRYIGIDAPETTQKDGKVFLEKPAPFAAAARRLNSQLVLGKFVRIEFDIEKIDAYGRILGYCFIDNTFVNSELLTEGVAVLYTRPPNVAYTDRLRAAQRDAQRNERGLWQSSRTIGANEAHRYINEVRTVRGKVLSTYRATKRTFLNFGNDYKRDFTIVIFNDCRDFFTRRNIEPSHVYQGRVVEVTGRIREYNGPEIIVCMPDDIRIID